MGGWAWYFLEVAGGLLALFVGGEYHVRGAAQLARSLGVSAMVVGLTIVAMGTSMPELVVSVLAALRDQPDFTIGNAVGSNIFNLLPVLGIVALVKPVKGKAAFINRELPVMLGGMLLAWAFSSSGYLSRPLAGLMLAGLAGYLYLAVRLARRERAGVVVDEFREGVPHRADPVWKDLVFLVGGFALMLVGAHFVVDGGASIARRFGVSELVIGLTLFAMGTSAPELFTCLVAVRHGEDDLALGNLVGSCTFNMLGILGASGVIAGLSISNEILYRDMPVMVGAAVVVWAFVWSAKRINRIEGALLLAAYIAYFTVIVQSSPATGAS